MQWLVFCLAFCLAFCLTFHLALRLPFGVVFGSMLRGSVFAGETVSFVALTLMARFTHLFRRRRGWFFRLLCSRRLLACRLYTFGALQVSLSALFLFNVGEGRHAAARQAWNESQRVAVNRHRLPGFDRESRDPHDIVPGFARQACATLKPFDYAVRAGIVGGSDKTEIAKLQA
jgi:hypothetical protein